MLSLLSIGLKEPWSPNFNTSRSRPSQNFKPLMVKAGAALFYKKGCQYCHKIDEQGGNVGPNLSQIGRTLVSPESKLKIVNGGPDMPALGNLEAKKN